MKIPFTKKDYWIRVGISFTAVIAADLIISMVAGSERAIYVYLLVVAYWAYLEVRRLHDANKTGLLALINLLPVLGTFGILVYAGVLDSNHYDNKWLN